MQRHLRMYILSGSFRRKKMRTFLLNRPKQHCTECRHPNSHKLTVFKNMNLKANSIQENVDNTILDTSYNSFSLNVNLDALTAIYTNDLLHNKRNIQSVFWKWNKLPFYTGHILPAYIASTGRTETNTLQRSFYSSQVKRGETEKEYSKDENVLERKLIGDRKHILTVPNILTTGRMIVTPYLAYLVLTESFPLACSVFILAGISDVLDGWIARHFKNQSTALGSFLDPLADKILISMLYVTLSMVHIIPAALTVLVLSRDVALIAAAFYIRYISLPKPVTLKQYFDLTNPSAQLKPLTISKINTAVQFILVAASLSAPVLGFQDHILLQALWYTTATTTAASGICYCLYAKDTFKLSNSPSESKND